MLCVIEGDENKGTNFQGSGGPIYLEEEFLPELESAIEGSEYLKGKPYRHFINTRNCLAARQLFEASLWSSRYVRSQILPTVLYDLSYFDANARPERNLARIDITLGSTTLMSALANVLMGGNSDFVPPDYFDFLREAGDNWNHTGAFPKQQWINLYNPHAQAIETQLVLDSVTMLWFHEFGHVLGGHLHHPKLNSDNSYRKAMEMEADWAAGWLSLRFMLSQHENHQVELPGAIYRCVLAALLFTCSMRLCTKERQARYHHINTRLSHIRGGMALAWRSLGHDPEIYDDVDFNVHTKTMNFWIQLEEKFKDLWLSPVDPALARDVAEASGRSKVLIQCVANDVHEHRYDALWDSSRFDRHVHFFGIR